MESKQKITPFLWFDTEAEAAARFYKSVFPDSAIGDIRYRGEAVMTVPFYLSGQPFTALNGGPMFTFNPSVSFYVMCEGEAEIDLKVLTIFRGFLPRDKFYSPRAQEVIFISYFLRPAALKSRQLPGRRNSGYSCVFAFQATKN